MTWHGGASLASALLHPLPILAIGVLLLNDHYLKAGWSHPVTGKLSDVAGLIFFPLLLVAIVEVGQAACGWYRGPSRRLLVGAIATTGLVFALVQLYPPMTEAYRVAFAALQRPVLAVDLLAQGVSLEAWPRVAATPDASDLLALPALLVAYALGSRAIDQASVTASRSKRSASVVNSDMRSARSSRPVS